MLTSSAASGSSATSSQHDLHTFTAISLKPLLQFITTECIASMPAFGMNVVDFVLQVLARNKEHLYEVCGCRFSSNASMRLSSCRTFPESSESPTAFESANHAIENIHSQSFNARSELPPPSSEPSFAIVTDVDTYDSSLAKCASAVVSGTKRLDSNFLRQIFERHKDSSGCIPASNLVLALSDADSPLIPDSEAAAAGTIARFDCNSNGLMEFSEFERTIALSDELALYFREKLQPSLADALRALVGRSSDQLLRVSRLSPSDLRAAYTAVCASLPDQAESLFEELRRSFAAQFEIQTQSAADSSKFNVVKMACGGIADFHAGLTGRVGMPNLKFKEAMRQEHCEKVGCNTSFTTGNYKITTTPKQEWLYIAGDGTGQQIACPDMGHSRRILRISELMKLKLAIDSKLTEVEMLAIVLYTGPMFQVYNCILRRFPADKYKLFHDGSNLYATTIFVLVSAVQKVSRCTRIPEGTLLFRGLGGLIDLPDNFHSADEQGRSGYLDWGMMSTTSDRDVALGYSGVKQRRPKAMVMVIEATSVDRGADISEFSQYPGEMEFLWVPCSFVQRVQTGGSRVQVVDSGLVTFVPVRVNLNLKTETVEELLLKKKSMHLTGFEFRINELRQQLQDDSKAGNAESRLMRDRRMEFYWKKQHSAEDYIEAQVKKVQVVLQKHRARAATDYTDDAVYRSLVSESLEAASMARSALQWWLRDSMPNIHQIQDLSLLSLHRSFESFLQLLYLRAATKEERCTAAVELCKLRNLLNIDIHEKDGNGEPPLAALASRGGSGEDVVLLVAAGADVGAAISGGQCALYFAAKQGHVEVAESLVREGANINQTTTEGVTPLFIACERCHINVVTSLLARGAAVNQAKTENSVTPLFIASQNGHTSVVEALLTQGADAVQATNSGVTPFFIACQGGHFGVAEALLNRGAGINHTKDNGATPLFTASQFGHTRIVELLLSGGAAVNQAKTDTGGTPLFIASQYGHISVVELLLAWGAAVNQAKTNDGATPLFIACQKGHTSVAELLLSRGADVNQAKTNDGATPLFIASQDCHIDIVKLLLSQGAAVNQAKTDNGATPLIIASRKGHASVVELLLSLGADVNQGLLDNCATPLWIASQNGHTCVVEVLLSRGASVDQATNDGISPLHIANQKGHISVVHILLARAADASPITFASNQAAKHAASIQLHRSAGSIVVNRHRGGGCVAPNYEMQFEDFSTFVADIRLSGRCFYFEVHVVDIVSVMQFGVCAEGFEPCQYSSGEGTGDDALSWAVDGARLKKWHKGSSKDYGSKWAVGDVIGFAVDMRIAGAAVLSTSLNGSFEGPSGAAFVDIRSSFLSPAFSGSGRYIVNFGEWPFDHAPSDIEYVSAHAFHQE